MTCPLFVELCAGTAALSLRLQGGRAARPPVSRMGAKTGYATTILSVLGLRPGEGAAHYLWCEPDDGARLMLIAYTDPELRRAAASIIRGWASEEPRALWTRLRDEGPVKGCPPTWPGPTPPYGHEVARWAWLGVRSWKSGARHGFQVASTKSEKHDGGANYGPTTPAGRIDALPTMPATILDRATDPPTLPPGTIAYLDPSYVGTTSYADNLPRSEVVRLARAWHEAGALVVVSEAEPIPDLIGDGWHAMEITGGRVGAARTFSRQQREWLTMSRAPAWRPSEQVGLFG